MFHGRLRICCILLLTWIAPNAPLCAQQWANKMFKVRSHDFGTVARGADVSYRFELQNIYEEDVHISHVASSCGCTTPSITKKTLETWEKGAILAKFNTDSFTGPRSATIRVAIDRPFPAEVQLQVKGAIRGDLSFEPGRIEFGNVNQASKRRATVRIIKRQSPNWRIQDVKSTFPHIQVGLREIARNFNQVQYEMIVELQKDAPAGFLNGALHIVTNERSHSNIPINFVAHVVPALEISPSILALGSLAPGEKTQKKVFLKAKQPFHVTKVDCSAPCLSVEGGRDDKRTHILTVNYQAGGALGRHECAATITTNLGEGATTTLKTVANIVGEKAQ